MKRFLFFSVLVALLFAGGYALFKKSEKNATLHNDGKLQVVTSFYPLYFFAQQIGGDRADVTNIVPAGAEPHDYEPTSQDMATMERSQLIILNGGGLEAWADNLSRNTNTVKTTIVTAGEGLATAQVTEGNRTVTDPHVWLDPPLAEKMIERIAQGFERVDPVNAEYYKTNAGVLEAKLIALDTKYKLGLGMCAEKSIITSHAAFGYLATTYGLNQVPIAGLSPDAEPSPSQLADIVQFAKTNQVKYIFFESLASPKLSQTIATEVSAQTLVLNPLEGLSDEDLAKGEDYFSVMYDNLTHLQTALACIPQTR